MPLTTTAFLGVTAGQPALGENPADSYVRVIGEDDTTAAESNNLVAGTDQIVLRTLDAADGAGFAGHVSVTLLNIDVPGRRIFGAFDVDELQASAQPAGHFKGFKVYGLGGNDLIDASGLRNFERTELNGNDVLNLRGNFSLPADPGPPPGAGTVSDDDKIIGGELSRDRYSGGRGNDTIVNVDEIDTKPAVPAVPGNPFVPQINGDGGDDVLEFRASSAGVILSGGISDLSFVKITTTQNDDIINLTGGPNGVEVNALAGNDFIVGTGNADTVNAGAGNDTAFGGGGNDILNGDEGDDQLGFYAVPPALPAFHVPIPAFPAGGDAGNDTMNGGAGNDSIRGGDGNDSLNGGDNNDSMYGGLGDDAMNGGTGEDLADYRLAPGPVLASLAAGQTLQAEGTVGNGLGDGEGAPGAPPAGKDTFVDIENLRGSDNAAAGDFLEGNGVANKIWGGAGNDRIRGGAGDDTLDGEDGNDTADGEDGNDTVRGSAGDDKLLGGKGNDVLEGGVDDDELYGEEGSDQLLGGPGGFMVSDTDILDGGLGFDIMEGDVSTGQFDVIRTNYDYDRGAIQDWLIKGGTAQPDSFEVQTLVFQAGATWDAPDQALDNAKKMDLVRRLDAQFELNMANPTNNSFGARDLVFSDYDGGEFDALTFNNPI